MPTLCANLMSRNFPEKQALRQQGESSKKWINTATCQISIICTRGHWDLWRVRSSGHQAIKQISKKIQDATGEKLSTFSLFQSISMAIQKGNAECVTGCVKDQSSGLEGLFNFHVQEAEEL